MTRILPRRVARAVCLAVALSSALRAAEPPPPPSEAVQLSPFLVSTEGDEGYRAANTLSGTRMNASLFHTPAAISVLTKEFLDDIAAENVADMLKFATSADNERTDSTGGLAQAWDVRATIRGFTESIITRDYLPNMVQSRGILANDRFNVDRADVSRGPNSILYGASRPGGALNVNTKRAVLNSRQKSAQLTVGRFAKKRSEADLAFPLIKDQLALRTNAMWEDRGGWFESEMLRAKGLALAATWQPLRHTQVRASVERMIRRQVTPGNFPQPDFGYSRWVKGGAPLGGNPLPGTNPAPTLMRTINTVQVVYAPQIRAQPFRLSTTGADMRPDLPGTQAPGFWETISGPAAPSGGTIDDPYYGQVIPATAYLAGLGRSTDNDYTLSSVFVDQRVGPVNVELGYARTNYFRGFTQPNVGAIGDPNPVLPGAYFADGDSVIAAGRAPGTLMPDIARANPFAGLPYVQSQAVRQLFDQHTETWRATVGYELDLSRRRAWLGRHSFAAAWQKERGYFGNGVIAEFNLAPGNSQPIDSATNTILRRTYLDFTKPGGARGGFDAWANPIPESPGMKAGFVFNNNYPWVAQKNTSGMLALQSRFPSDRIVLTGGYRRDRADVMDANAGGERVPNSTNAWLVRPFRFDGATVTSYTGTTKTLGAVVTALPWLGFSYNQSQSVFPQGNFKDIFTHVLPPIEGDGRDYGVRLILLGGRLSANVNLYRADGANQFQPSLNAPKNNIVTAANAVLTTLRARGQPLPASVAAAGITLLSSDSRDASDFEGRGTEIEITGRLTAGWSITLNAARNELRQANILSDSMAFLGGVKAAWESSTVRLDDTPAAVATFVRSRDGTPSRDFVTNPATFADVYAYSLSVAEPFLRGTGKAPFAHVEKTFNAFTSYRFTHDAPQLLRGARAGLGANYRGPAVIGYDSANNDAVILGRSAIVWNGMLGRRFALPRGQSFDLQLNVENIFGQEDRLPYSATAPGVIVRYLLPRVRHSWSLRATYNF